MSDQMDEKQPAVNMINPPKTLTWEVLGSPRKKHKAVDGPSQTLAEEKAEWCGILHEVIVLV
jgi:hypothetical protein